MRFLDLGVLRIEHAGTSLLPGGHAPAAILSTLLLHLGHRVARDLLIDAVWGDQVPDKAERTVATHLWRLRRTLTFDEATGRSPSVIANDAGGYRLTVAPETVSSARFEQLTRHVAELMLADRPDQALLAADEALQLWQGTPFQAVAERGWAVGPVARLDELHTALRERRIETILATGDAQRAIAECRPLTQEYPLRERLWEHLMVGYYRAGRPDEALDAYQQARQVLLDETGLEPSSELMELQRRVLHRDPALQEPARVRVAPHASAVRLPAPRRLIGRTREMAELARLLVGRHLVTVVGSAGCGKTALAIETARGLADRFTDGVWFVDLSAAQPESDVAAQVVAALGQPSPRTGRSGEVLAAYAADRSALLLLDNCEHVLEQVADLCDSLAAAGSRLPVLATSQEELGVAGETVVRIDPLPSAAGPDEAESPAARLFIERDRRGRTPAQFDADERAAVDRICHAVDGLPLALELAAGWTHAYTLDEIADQVAADPTGLAAVGRTRARQHHDSLFATVDHSYRLLSPAEQALHRRLSVLPGGFDRAMASELAGDGLEAREVGGLLARLAHRSLLRVEKSGAQTVFAQLETIRSHAGHALAAARETAATQDRRDGWTDRLAARRPVLGRPEEVSWRAEVAAGLPVVRATMHRRLLIEHDPRGVELACRLLDHWYFSGLVGEGVQWARLAVGIAQSALRADPVGPAESLLTLATLLTFEGSTAEASAVLGQALSAVHGSPQPQRLVWPLVKAAAAWSLTYEAEPIRELLVAAEPHIGESADLAVAVETLYCLADSMAGPSNGVVDRAQGCFARAEAVGNDWVAFLACSVITASALYNRDPELGLPWTQRAAALQRRLGARSVPQQYEVLANLLVLRGDLDAAVGVYSASFDKARGGGAVWPRNRDSQSLLATARQGMAKASFERAWALGRTQDPLELRW